MSGNTVTGRDWSAELAEAVLSRMGSGDSGVRDAVATLQELASVFLENPVLCKYPTIFNTADVAVITKIDLAEAVEFDATAANHSIESVRPSMTIFNVSAKTGSGIEEFLMFLQSRRSHAPSANAPQTARAFAALQK